LIWQTDVGKRIRESPAVANGTIFLGNKDKHIYALDIASGRVKWRQATDCEYFSSPTVYFDKVLIKGRKVKWGGSEHRLYALDAVNGSILWKYEGAYAWWDNLLSPPAVLTLPEVTPDNKLKAYVLYPLSETSIDLINIYTSKSEGKILDRSKSTLALRPCSLATNKIFIFLGWGFHGKIVGYYSVNLPLSLIQGLTLYSTVVDDIVSPPAISGDYLFTTGKRVYGVNISRLTKRWRSGVQFQIQRNFPPTIGMDMLFIADHNKRVYAFKGTEEQRLHQSLEVGANIATDPVYEAIMLSGAVRWPSICYLCGESPKKETAYPSPKADIG